MNSNWLDVIRKNYDEVGNFITEYNVHYINARKDIKIEGNLIENSKRMPTLVDLRYSQFEDINSVLELLEIEVRKMKSIHFKKYTESYQRQLSSRDIEKYIDGEIDVVELSIKINRVSLLRNKFAGITKALESKQYQISNIVKLKVAGLDDSEIGFHD